MPDTLVLQPSPSGKLKVFRKTTDAERAAISRRTKEYWARLKAKPTWGARQPDDIDASTGEVFTGVDEPVSNSILLGLSDGYNSRNGTQPDTKLALQYSVGDRVSGADPYSKNYSWIGTIEEIDPGRDDLFAVRWDRSVGEYSIPTTLRRYSCDELRSYSYTLPPINLPLPEALAEDEKPDSEFKHWGDWDSMSAEERDEECNDFHPDNPNNPENNPDKGKGFSKSLNDQSRQGRYPRCTNKTLDKVADCTVLFQNDIYSKEMLAFVTLTLCDMASEDEASININISYIIKTFRDELRRQLKKISKQLNLPYIIDLEDVGVIEISKKAIARGKAKWHLHFVFRNKSHASGRWLITPKVMDKIWQDAVNKYTNKTYVINANKMEAIRKDAAAYLAKYISKGCEQELNKLKVLGIQLPVIHSWYFIANSIKQYLRNWLECHKREVDYPSGLIGFQKKLLNPTNRKKIKGLKDRDPIAVSRISREGDEVLVCFVMFFNFRERDIIADRLVEAMQAWSTPTRETQGLRPVVLSG